MESALRRRDWTDSLPCGTPGNQPRRTVSRDTRDEVWTVAFSPDGEWLATGSDDGTARLWKISQLPKSGFVPLAETAVCRGRRGGRVHHLGSSRQSADSAAVRCLGESRVWV